MNPPQRAGMRLPVRCRPGVMGRTLSSLIPVAHPTGGFLYGSYEDRLFDEIWCGAETPRTNISGTTLHLGALERQEKTN